MDFCLIYCVLLWPSCARITRRLTQHCRLTRWAAPPPRCTTKLTIRINSTAGKRELRVSHLGWTFPLTFQSKLSAESLTGRYTSRPFQHDYGGCLDIMTWTWTHSMDTLSYQSLTGVTVLWISCVSLSLSHTHGSLISAPWHILISVAELFE